MHFRGKGMYNTPNHPFTPTPTQITSKVDEYLRKKKFDKIIFLTNGDLFFFKKIFYVENIACGLLSRSVLFYLHGGGGGGGGRGGGSTRRLRHQPGLLPPL